MAKLIDINQLEEVIPFLFSGKVVGFPTETVYGLAVVYNNFEAFEKLVQVKKRPITKPITAMVFDVESIKKLAYIDKRQEKIINTFMPGSITIILPAKDNLPTHVTMKQTTIGIRIPSNKTALQILKMVNVPLLVTSANISTLPSCVKYQEVINLFGSEVSAIVTEDSLNELASTVVDLTKDEPILLRKGPIEFAEILKVWRDEK